MPAIFVRIIKATAFLLCTSLIIFSATLADVTASQYTPDDLYRYQYVRLANGLDIFLKPRPGAHNVSMRMLVHTGTYDFSCGVKETPHFLEHLLFTGTSKHSETELDALIEDNGGSWNASTGGEKTIYEIDIHDRYSSLAMDTLYEILTDSIISAEDVERTRRIIHREAGGKPSDFRRWLYRQGIGRSAHSKAEELIWPAEFNCQDLETAENITQKDIRNAKSIYYVPNNMALIVVGNFAAEKMLSRIKQSFGRLKKGPLPDETTGVSPRVSRQRVTGTFSPILGTDGQVALNYQIDGYQSGQVFPIILINELMNQEMFRQLRVEQGLAYAPSSAIGLDRNTGVLTLSADTSLGKMDRVEQSMLDLVNSVRNKPMLATELERIRRRVLLTYAQGYEDNHSIASHYASVWRRYESNGRIVDLEKKLLAVGLDDFTRLISRILDPAKAIIVISRPTISYHGLYLLLTLVLGLSCLIGVIFWWRRRRGGVN